MLEWILIMLLIKILKHMDKLSLVLDIWLEVVLVSHILHIKILQLRKSFQMVKMVLIFEFLLEVVNTTSLLLELQK